MSVRIITTGGTFDKKYNELDGSLVFDGTHLPEMLSIAKNELGIKIEDLMAIDSLDMEEDHREKILKKCRSCKEDKIIITHGTDTMVETAKLLGEHVNDKVIVLTGAMVPYSFGKGDALFNLGCAFGLIQTLDKGVYITMNGKLFRWDGVRKNRELGKFEKIK